MKMENIMNYKVYLYAIFTFLSIFMLSGINFDKIMRKNRVLEARFLILFLSLAISYLLTNFVADIVNL